MGITVVYRGNGIIYLIYLDGSYFGCITAKSENDAFNYLKTKYIKLVESDSTLSRFEDKKNYDGWEWELVNKALQNNAGVEGKQ